MGYSSFGGFALRFNGFGASVGLPKSVGDARLSACPSNISQMFTDLRLQRGCSSWDSAVSIPLQTLRTRTFGVWSLAVFWGEDFWLGIRRVSGTGVNSKGPANGESDYHITRTVDQNRGVSATGFLPRMPCPEPTCANSTLSTVERFQGLCSRLSPSMGLPYPMFHLRPLGSRSVQMTGVTEETSLRIGQQACMCTPLSLSWAPALRYLTP